MNGKDWPVTLADAVKRVVDKLSDADKKAIAKMKKDDLIMLHMSLGMAIRNDFDLWQGNDSLIKECQLMDPDDISGEIIDAVWAKLKKS